MTQWSDYLNKSEYVHNKITLRSVFFHSEVLDWMYGELKQQSTK